MKTKKIIKVMAGVLVLLLAVCGMVYGLVYKDKAVKAENIPEQDENENEMYVVHEGKKYALNHDLKAVLFMGIDNKGTMVDVNGYTGYNGQTDTLIVFIMDSSTKKTTMFQISRNSMTDIKLYDMSGEYSGTKKAQIAIQFAYGDGKEKSCMLTKNAVSNLLLNVPIQSYIGLNMEGVDKIVDIIGGVPITLTEDATHIDPAFKQGVSVTLNGEQAERYVRYRDTNVTGSNEQRMERQTKFLMTLASQLKSSFGMNPAIYNTVFGGANPYMHSNMSADEMQILSDYEISEEVLTVPGEVVQGEKHDEFLVNDTQLYKLLLKVFYKPVN